MSSINELICDELIYWKFEISSTAQSKNQLNWASCGLDQSIETIQSMGSINNQSTDRYSRWGPPACSNVLAGWASLILPACGPPTVPARPPRQRALPLFFLCLKREQNWRRRRGHWSCFRLQNYNTVDTRCTLDVV